MNIDRLLRDVEARLADWDEPQRLEVMDALREALARERRSLDPSFTVESERERRQNAEELRGALEAIHRSVRSPEALEEVLKQLERVVPTDFAVLAVAEPGAGLRISAVRGAELQVFEGALLADDPRVTLAREERIAVSVRDAEADKAPFPLVGAPPMRSWMALPLLLEGDVVGMLVAGRHALDTFSNEDVLRAKAVASWTAATLRRVQQLDQLRRYATLLEQVADVDQRVFSGESPDALARRDRRGRLPGRQLPRRPADPADPARAGGGGGDRRGLRGRRRAHGTGRPRLRHGATPAGGAHARRGRVARDGAARGADLPGPARHARGVRGLPRSPRPERGVARRPPDGGLRLAHGTRLPPRRAAPRAPLKSL